MTVKSSARVGYLNAILAQGGGNLNNSIFKSSNARGLPGGGGGMLMFRIDRRISSIQICLLILSYNFLTLTFAETKLNCYKLWSCMLLVAAFNSFSPVVLKKTVN